MNRNYKWEPYTKGKTNTFNVLSAREPTLDVRTSPLVQGYYNDEMAIEIKNILSQDPYSQAVS